MKKPDEILEKVNNLEDTIEAKAPKGGKLSQLIRRLNHEIRRKKKVGTVYIILRFFVIVSFIVSLFEGNFSNAMLCVLTMILFMLPAFVEDTFRIELPGTFEIIILLFIFAAEILGEIRAFYTLIPGWDTMLHTLNGFNCAAIGFCLVDFFNRNKHFSMKMSPFYLAVTAFCFSMTVGVLWEFFEFSMDYFFHLDMQKDFVVGTIASVSLDPKGMNNIVKISDITDVILVQKDGTQTPLGLGGYLDIGIIDTMKDLIVNFVGAVVFSTVGAIHAASRDKKNKRIEQFTEQFIPKVLDSEETNKDK